MRSIFIVFVMICIGCQHEKVAQGELLKNDKRGIQVVVLGTVQDGGAPHIGCTKSCCEKLWDDPDKTLKVVSLGIIDHDNNKSYIVEATPDFPEQLAHLNQVAGRSLSDMPDGIFITHAHIGHYTGLMFLGREAKGAKNIPVYSMPKLQEFLSANGPWDQLVSLQNIELRPFGENGSVHLSKDLKVTSFRVPHRDEYSETVGFTIEGPNHKVLFIPDIDKWTKWDEDIIEKVKEVDLAFLDATFYDANEINNRDIREIPHPFVVESMGLFDLLPKNEKAKIHFIHLNHTNPLLDSLSNAYQEVLDNGYFVARIGKVFSM